MTSPIEREGQLVALRKESVDRNHPCFSSLQHKTVALRKESVDRNLTATVRLLGQSSRSPQGERG